MTVTPSTMLPLGTKAPAFNLTDTISGERFTLDDLKSDNATVIMFICNHCPFVIHVRDELIKITNDYESKGIAFIAINSNDVETYPTDSPDNMKKMAEQYHYPFAYLFDETQDVAKSYHAACTPDFYVFDKGLRCVYRGQLDSSRPGNNKPVTGSDLRATLDAILENKPVDSNQVPSQGCNIKWR